jgi:hypothetical protein
MVNVGKHELHHGNCLDILKSMPDKKVSLTLTSPPYEDCRTYGIDFSVKGQDWVDWFIPIVIECCRITDGLVLVNAAGKVRDFKYSPVMEWLVADLTRKHGIVCGPSPYVYYRVGIPGSGGHHYHRRDWEPVYAFALPDRLPLNWSDNKATGHKPKWVPGGEMSYRLGDGKRANHKSQGRDKWGNAGESSGEGRNADGSRKKRKRFGANPEGDVKVSHDRDIVDIANAGNRISEMYDADMVKKLLDDGDAGDIVHCKVGGGLMGHPLASQNEAPMSLTLASWFVRSYAPPGSYVLDPFMGSGTSLHACLETGRIGIGIDIRESQVELTKSRLESVTPSMF